MGVERIIIILIIKWNDIIRYENNIIIIGVLVAIETESKETERIGISTGADDDRWTYTVGPLAAVATGEVVGLVADVITGSVEKQNLLYCRTFPSQRRQRWMDT